jgi:regulator of protease activity HflC (stomatin/prohibitin superfamily)
MNNFKIKAQIIAVIFVISAILFALCTYIVDEREQVIVTQFGTDDKYHGDYLCFDLEIIHFPPPFST